MTDQEEPQGQEITEEIVDESPHTFFAMVPKLIEYMALSPFAYRLYGHFKQVTGETGKCTKGTRSLAAICGMSMGSISKAKKELTSTAPPLIRITETRSAGGINHRITITDIWGVNNAIFNGESVHVVNAKGESVHVVNAERSCGERNKILSTKKKKINSGDPKSEVDQQTAQQLETFTGRFGKFHSEREIETFLACVEEYGMGRVREALMWAERKEIHLQNRPGLMESLETAMAKWKTGRGSQIKIIPQQPTLPDDELRKLRERAQREMAAP